MNDELEQAFREGYTQGKSEDSRIIQIANHYGYTAQREQFEEECGEAIVAAQKCKRDGSMKAFNDLCGEGRRCIDNGSADAAAYVTVTDRCYYRE